jgi:hypothetical protein
MNGAPAVWAGFMYGPPAARPEPNSILVMRSRSSKHLLFHGDTLRQVSGLVYVAAAPYGYVVGEELEGDYF